MSHIKKNSEDLNQLLQETFTNEFRTGYETVEGVTMFSIFNKIIDSIENLEIRDDDVWVCSFPKSGTTWTQEMVWCISHDLDFTGAETDLETRFPFLESSAIIDHSVVIKNFPELENHEFLRDSVKYVEHLPHKRFIKTHLPFHLLPRDLREGRTRAKIIYVCRNPKDVCISFYHHAKHFAYRGDFQQFCRLFLGDKVPYSPFWSHVSGFWEKRNDSSCNILFLKYEEMKVDLGSVIERTVEFLEKPKLSTEKLQRLLNHLSFGNMKLNPAVNHKKRFGFTRQYLGASGEAEFIRQGQINQWKAVMSREISEEFDEWISRNSQSSDLSFYFLDSLDNKQS